MELSFVIPGDPVAKGRPRASKFGHSYTPAKTRAAEKAIRDLVAPMNVVAHDGPVRVSLGFFCATKRRTDLDNLVKLVTDALNGIAYVDDYLIEHIDASVVRGVKDEARTQVFVASL